MKAIRVREPGSPGVMRYEDVPTPKPREGDVLVKIKAAGVNYIDVYFRKGSYLTNFPFTPGMEGSGIVEESNAEEFSKGDRVAYTGIMGSYAEFAVIPEDRLVKLPAESDFETGATVMLQGTTAHYLSHSAYEIKKGDTVLIHAAAGGVGTLLVQMAKMKGATVIGTVSTREKAIIAKENGADEIILYKNSDFERELKKITAGKGVNVVYDGIGKDTFDQSINCLARKGYMVLYGASSGVVPPVDTRILGDKGSLFLTRPSLRDYTITREELLSRSGQVFAMVTSGKLKLHITKKYPLSEASKAHEDLEGRKTTGKLLLIP